MSKQKSPVVTKSYVSRLKQRAKILTKSTNCPLWQAQDAVAKDQGFSNWKAITGALARRGYQTQITPSPSLNFAYSDDTELSDSDLNTLNSERSDEPSVTLKESLSRNRAALAQNGIEYSIFEPTKTGLIKSILDATQTVRTHFGLINFHDYEAQPQQSSEEDHKVTKRAVFLTPCDTTVSRMSLYRPATKSGDPRMWFRGLGKYVEAGDQIAIVIFDGVAYLLNLSSFDLQRSLKQGDLIGQFLSTYKQEYSSISDELLNKLRAIACAPLIAKGDGDADVGNAVEAALGIAQNSSKKPDYKGIEIKSGRRSKNRTSMFAQVPMWTKSSCKSSKEIVQKYGYMRGDDLKLYCTISTKKPNPQGLYFVVPDNADVLFEKHVDTGNVAYWEGATLRKRILEKHKETFWIEASSEIVNGIEHFHLKKVIHTRRPVLSQLLPLIASGVVTMDHLIKIKGGETNAHEKGPLFKIDKRNLSLLFPEPVEYIL